MRTPTFSIFFLAVRHTSDHPCFCHCRRIGRDAAVRSCPIASARCGTAHTVPNHPPKWPRLPRCAARRLVVLGASSPFLLVVSTRRATNPGFLVEHASVSFLLWNSLHWWSAQGRICACTRKAQWTPHAWSGPEGRVCSSSSSIPSEIPSPTRSRR